MAHRWSCGTPRGMSTAQWEKEQIRLTTRLQDAFRQFPYSTVPTAALQHSIGLLPQGATGIVWCQQKSHVTSDR